MNNDSLALIERMIWEGLLNTCKRVAPAAFEKVPKNERSKASTQKA